MLSDPDPARSARSHPRMMGPFAAAWVRGAALIVAIVALLLLSEAMLSAWPARWHITATPTALTIEVDGQQHVVPLSTPLAEVRVLAVEPRAREYQIDGSDTTNNFTFDARHFARIGDTAYYRFQSLLRDEGSYSQWRNLVIRDGAGQVVVQSARPAGPVAVPSSFGLDIALHRPEVPRALELVGTGGDVLRVEVSRNDRYVRVVSVAASGQEAEVLRRFYPNDGGPFAAEIGYTVLRVVALVLGLALGVMLLAAMLPVGWRGSPSRWHVALFNSMAAPGQTPGGKALGNTTPGLGRFLVSVPVLAAAVALAGGVYASLAFFDRAPHILDAVSYYFQGKVFASGMLAAPAPPVESAFQYPFAVVHGGQWFSQYPPGTPLTLAAGFLIGAPWLIEPLLAAGAVLLTFLIAQRLYGRGTAMLTAALMASSPFLHLQSGSFISHVPAMVGAVVFLFGVTRYLAAPSRRWMALLAVGLGYTFLCREVVAVLYGLPIGAFVIAQMWRRWPARLRTDLGLGVAILGGFFVAYLGYNWALTGLPLQPPRILFSPGDFFGFGSGIGFYGQHTPAAGLVNTDQLLTSLSIVLFGWPFYFSLALVAAPFVLRRATGYDALLGAVCGLFVVAYFTYFYHGIALGPRYYFEMLPLLAMLAARGFVTLTEATRDWLAKVGRGDESSRARVVTAGLCAALILCNGLYFWPRQTELYAGYSGLPWHGPIAVSSVMTYDLGGRQAGLDNALVVTDDWWLYVSQLAALNTPRLDGPAVFALMPREGLDRLRAAFPERTVYRAELNAGRLAVNIVP